MASTTTTPRPLSTAAGKRQAILHGLFALVALAWPFLGKTSRPTPIEGEQLLVGALGILVTYFVPELGKREAPYVKAGATFLVAVATALVPVLQHVGWHQLLTHATGGIVLMHLFAAISGLVLPNATTPVATASAAPTPTVTPGAEAYASAPAAAASSVPVTTKDGFNIDTLNPSTAPNA